MVKLTHEENIAKLNTTSAGVDNVDLGAVTADSNVDIGTFNP